MNVEIADKQFSMTVNSVNTVNSLSVY
jgi:hypothetical protein